MSGHRFFLSPEIFNNTEIDFPAAIAHQISTVLRLKRGQTVIILDNLGNFRSVELGEVANRSVTGKASEMQVSLNEPKVHLILCPALTQRDKFEWILQKGCELGVGEFRPLLTARTLAQDTRGWEEKLPRWQKILQEAAEQCGRGLIPTVTLPQRFEQALRQLQSIPGFILHEKEQQTGLAAALQIPGKSTALLVGPEGGFSDGEVKMAIDAGIKPVSLGKRVLRMETAAIAACAVFMSVSGELGDLTYTK